MAPGKRCGKWKKGAKKLLKKVNLANRTASWTKEICECVRDQCAEWKDDLEDDINNTNKACDELDKQFRAWAEVWNIWRSQANDPACAAQHN